MRPIHYNYKIGDEDLVRVFKKRYLGVIMDTKLNFSAHIEYVTAKAYAMLGIKRICHEFRSLKALKSIYYAHIRSQLESIQKKFVIYALRRTVKRDRNYRLPPYESRCKTIGIETIGIRRINLSAFLIYDVLTNRSDAPELKSQVITYQPNRVYRANEFISINTHRTDYGYEPLNNMCMIFNNFAHLYDQSEWSDVKICTTTVAENASFVRYNIG